MTRYATLRKALLSVFLGLVFIGGCDRDGPAERAGEAIDEGVENAEEKAREVGNKVEDACEDVTKENC